MQNNKKSLISAIIVYTQKDKKLVKQCLHSLETSAENAGLSLEFILVANGTKPLKINYLLSPFTQIILKTNVGFGSGVNKAMVITKGEWCIIACPDVNTDKIALIKITKYLNSDKIALIGPKINLPDGRIQPTILPIPSLYSIFIEQSFIYKLLPWIFHSPLSDRQIYQYSHSTDCVAAIWWFINKTAFKKSGKFNRNYFLYFEDVDLCKRLRSNGFQIYFDPEITVKHIPHQSTAGVTDGRLYSQSLTIFLNIHYDVLSVILSLIIFKFGCLIRILFWNLKAKMDRRNIDYINRKIEFCRSAIAIK